MPGFDGSRAHLLLRDTLTAANYTIRETLLCPTQLGMPNRRERFYLVAGLTPLDEWHTRAGVRRAVADLLDGSPDPALWCDDALARDYAGELDLVDAGDPGARTACFTAAYGRSPVRSGLYLVTPSGLGRFSPGEMLRLLDFPGEYRLPAELPLRAAWRLAGNSVSVRAVRWVLSAWPGLGGGEVYLKNLSDLKKELQEAGPSYVLSVTTNQVVVDWIVAHIQQTDMKFGEYLKKRP